MCAKPDGIRAVRGRGLLTAFELQTAVAPKFVSAALDAGFIVNATDEHTIRLAPPLIITREQLETFLAAVPQLLTAAVYTLRTNSPATAGN